MNAGQIISTGRLSLKQSPTVCNNHNNTWKGAYTGIIRHTASTAGPQSRTTTWVTRYDAFLAPGCVLPRHPVEGRNLHRGLQWSTCGICSPPMQYLVQTTFTDSWQCLPRQGGAKKVILDPHSALPLFSPSAGPFFFISRTWYKTCISKPSWRQQISKMLFKRYIYHIYTITTYIYRLSANWQRVSWWCGWCAVVRCFFAPCCWTLDADVLRVYCCFENQVALKSASWNNS